MIMSPPPAPLPPVATLAPLLADGEGVSELVAVAGEVVGGAFEPEGVELDVADIGDVRDAEGTPLPVELADSGTRDSGGV
jgi:hypothetical protein